MGRSANPDDDYLLKNRIEMRPSDCVVGLSVRLKGVRGVVVKASRPIKKTPQTIVMSVMTVGNPPALDPCSQ